MHWHKSCDIFAVVRRLADDVVWSMEINALLFLGLAESVEQWRRQTGSGVGRGRHVAVEHVACVDAACHPEQARLFVVSLVRVIEVQLPCLRQNHLTTPTVSSITLSPWFTDVASAMGPIMMSSTEPEVRTATMPEEDWTTITGIMRKKLVKFGCLVPLISEWSCGQTDIHLTFSKCPADSDIVADALEQPAWRIRQSELADFVPLPHSDELDQTLVVWCCHLANFIHV